MSSTGPWQRYKSLRVQAFLSSVLALYLARFPRDLSHLASSFGAAALPAQTIARLTFAMFPIAMGLVGISTLRWLRFSCPGCDLAFFACGPDLFGRRVLMNPMASACGHCGLIKGTIPSSHSMRPIAALVPDLPETNVVAFEELLRQRAAELMAAPRKQA